MTPRPDPCSSCPLADNPACRGRRNVRWCHRAEAGEPGIGQLLSEVSGLAERTQPAAPLPASEAVAIVTPPAPPRAPWKTIESRLATCRTCEQYTRGTVERCRVFVDRGLAGALMHPLGVPNPSARCPIGKWGPEDQPS